MDFGRSRRTIRVVNAGTEHDRGFFILVASVPAVTVKSLTSLGP